MGVTGTSLSSLVAKATGKHQDPKGTPGHQSCIFYGWVIVGVCILCKIFKVQAGQQPFHQLHQLQRVQLLLSASFAGAEQRDVIHGLILSSRFVTITILSYTILYYTLLYSPILYDTILYSTILYYTTTSLLGRWCRFRTCWRIFGYRTPSWVASSPWPPFWPALFNQCRNLSRLLGITKAWRQIFWDCQGMEATGFRATFFRSREVGACRGSIRSSSMHPRDAGHPGSTCDLRLDSRHASTIFSAGISLWCFALICFLEVPRSQARSKIATFATCLGML